MKRCAEDGKCLKYLFSQNFACLVTNAVLTGHAWKYTRKTANVLKMAASMSIKLVHLYNVEFDSQLIATHMLI